MRLFLLALALVALLALSTLLPPASAPTLAQGPTRVPTAAVVPSPRPTPAAFLPFVGSPYPGPGVTP
jgi:hypothetical protein